MYSANTHRCIYTCMGNQNEYKIVFLELIVLIMPETLKEAKSITRITSMTSIESCVKIYVINTHLSQDKLTLSSSD